MNKGCKTWLLLGTLWAYLASAVSTSAQTFQTLHSFTALNNGANSDGAAPICGLVVSGNTLYGTTESGGTNGSGTIFAVNTEGTGFTNFHDFTGPDGSGPWTDLTLSGHTLYGTTQSGGTAGAGTIFRISTDGSGFTNLYGFNSDTGLGVLPLGPLVLSSNLLYGSTLRGDIFAAGTLYSLSTDGTAFTNLFAFTAGAAGQFPSALILSSNTLYGTCSGGSSSSGTVFTFEIGGNTLASPDFIHSFVGIDGIQPRAAVVLSNNVLYGTTSFGGINDAGTVFSINADGSGFSTLYNFATAVLGGQDSYMFAHAVNADGFDPEARLLLVGTRLYGTTYTGGSSGNGVVFAINTDGTGFTNLYTFSPLTANTNRDGANPRGGLAMSGNTLFGTTIQGGAFGNGTVFSISLAVTQPQLSINLVGGNAILTWPTNATNFSLQSTADLVPPLSWTSIASPPFVVVGGLNTFTNPLSGTMQFFRLSQ